MSRRRDSDTSKRIMGIRQAAFALRVHPATVRSWIAEGCPCVSVGEVGPGRGATVDLESVRAWRAARLVPGLQSREQADALMIVETALLDSLKRDDLARRVSISPTQAIHLVLLIYERAYRNIKESALTVDALSAQMKCLNAIYIESTARGHF